MFVSIDTVPDPAGDTANVLREKAGDALVALLQPLEQRALILVTRWPDAVSASPPPAAAETRRFERSETVVADDPTEPVYAQLIWFDGPRSSHQSEMINRASRERIWPAARSVTGAVGALIATAEDGALCTVAFLTSLQTVEDVQQAILSAALLPWEDAALLTGPDRVQLARVLAHNFPG